MVTIGPTLILSKGADARLEMEIQMTLSPAVHDDLVAFIPVQDREIARNKRRIISDLRGLAQDIADRDSTNRAEQNLNECDAEHIQSLLLHLGRQLYGAMTVRASNAISYSFVQQMEG